MKYFVKLNTWCLSLSPKTLKRMSIILWIASALSFLTVYLMSLGVFD